jgi:hypothetical protein
MSADGHLGTLANVLTSLLVRTSDSSVLTGCWKLPRPSLSINYALRLPIASRTSEFLSFVLESIVRSGRAPRKKHWFAAVPTARLIVHAKVPRLPQLVPHKPRPPARFEKQPIKRWKCVDRWTGQRDEIGTTPSETRKGQDTEKAQTKH